jgi:serine/threonine protein kinase
MIPEILLKKNLPHVVIVVDPSGTTEDLEQIGTLSESDISDVISGLKELHSADIHVLDIKVGRGREGQLKITDLSTFAFGDEVPIHTRYNLPESSYVKSKSDIWCLGCFLLGKNIPKRFMKSQELLDGFLKDSPEYVKIMLKINPNERDLPYTVDSNGGCVVQ